MKAFFFLNHIYLSETQYGVQAAHVLGRLNSKYLIEPHLFSPGDEICFTATKQAIMLSEWQVNHETIVFLEGGYQKHLQELLAFLDQGEHAYPYAYFCESEEALNGAMTCVGIIVDARLLAGREAMRSVMRLPRNDFYRQTFERTGTLEVVLNGTDLQQETYTPFEVELMQRLDKAKTA